MTLGGDLYTAAALPEQEDNSILGDDPGAWGHSMANMIELVEPVLNAAGARSVTEVGAYAGDFTSMLLRWADTVDGAVVAVDPLPQPPLIELDEREERLSLLAKTSADAFREMELTDAVIIDGDHNYYTVKEELDTIGARCSSCDDWPLLLLHDVAWPHARRDAYYAPDRVPEEFQDRIEEGVGVRPGEPGITLGGLPYKWAAREEGGERNGVLTALEDFLEGRDELQMALVPIFFGLAVVWHRDAPWADDVAAVLAPWDRNPILARLEGNRTRHLAQQHVARTYLHMEEDRVARQEKFLKGLETSEAFAVASRIVALRNRQGPTMREKLEEALVRDERLDLKPDDL